MTEVVDENEQLAQYRKYLDTYTYSTEEGSVKLIPFASGGGESVKFRAWVFKNGLVGPATGQTVDQAMDLIRVPEATQREIREIESKLNDEFKSLPGSKKEELTEAMEARDVEAELESLPTGEGA